MSKHTAAGVALTIWAGAKRLTHRLQKIEQAQKATARVKQLWSKLPKRKRPGNVQPLREDDPQ